MKITWYQFLVVLFFLVSPALINTAHAQDSDIDEVIAQPETDKMLYSPAGEGELRYGASSIHLAKDSASISSPAGLIRKAKPELTKPADKSNNNPKEEDEDSILSFNLLYYIIQYKLQELVD